MRQKKGRQKQLMEIVNITRLLFARSQMVLTVIILMKNLKI